MTPVTSMQSMFLESFNTQLRRAGWEVIDHSELRNAGVSMHPEGMAFLTHEAVSLEAQLLVAESEIRIYILDHANGQLIRLALGFTDHIDLILSELVQSQTRLNRHTFPSLLLRLSKHANAIWLIDHEGTRLLLDCPNSASAQTDG